MKYILTTLLLCVSSFCFSQDTLQIPTVELEEFFLALDTLETQDSIKVILIEQLEHEILLIIGTFRTPGTSRYRFFVLACVGRPKLVLEKYRPYQILALNAVALRIIDLQTLS